MGQGPATSGREAATLGIDHRVHIHIVNDPSVPSIYQITPALYEAALQRHGWAKARHLMTMGNDLEGFDEAMKTAEVLVGWKFPHTDLARRSPRLKWIQMTSAGIDHLLPLDWLPQDMVLTNNCGVHVGKAADYAGTAILMLNSRFPFFMTSQRERRWEKRFSTPPAGKTLAVIGVGNIGGAGAQRGKEFKLNVLGVRRTGDPHPYVDEMFRPHELDKVLPRADIVLISAALTSKTKGMIGRKEFDMMKRGAGLINMARGGLIDFDVLIEKLRSGDLGGAVIDGYPKEPVPNDSPLWTTPNLVMTPHIGSNDPEFYTPGTLDILFQNLGRYLERQPLVNVVDRSSEY
jgi:phosphoglycerate dehydrogenase-like enzyme